tara:strand:- start:176 stop:301 length:126 start_codon:yes stop_codon:yes gene_type:complete
MLEENVEKKPMEVQLMGYSLENVLYLVGALVVLGVIIRYRK